jgi:hypothetical protein
MKIAPKLADLPPCGLAPKDMVAQYLGQTAPKVHGVARCIVSHDLVKHLGR